MKYLFILACLSLLLAAQSRKVYNVVVKRLMTPDTIIAHSKGSAWGYNYNPAAYMVGDNIELLVRGQNKVNASVPFVVGPSYLGHSHITLNRSNVTATPPTEVAFPLDNVTEACGTEDPRIASLDGLYYLFYTAYDCKKAMLALATSEDPADPKKWTRRGFVFPEKDWSKSGAALFATKQNKLSNHYLFWGDSATPEGGIGVAVSDDGVKWRDTNQLLIKTRDNFFDSGLVEAGPPPLQLSTGDFLFIYNSARHGYPSVRPNWDLQYNLGFLILNETNPTNVLQRSVLPILSPNLDWEIGNTTMNLVPNVVFIEGLVPDPNGCNNEAREFAGVDANNANIQCFFGAYGGADSDVGALEVIVTWIDVPGEEGESVETISV